MAYLYAYLFWNLEKGECELIFIKRGNEFNKVEKPKSSYVEYSACRELISLRAVCLDLRAWGIQGPHSRIGRGRGWAVLGSCWRLLEETRWTLTVVSLLSCHWDRCTPCHSGLPWEDLRLQTREIHVLWNNGCLTDTGSSNQKFPTLCWDTSLQVTSSPICI